MSTLAREISVTPRSRLGAWAARAWRRMTWRHVLLAPLIEVASGILKPLGGYFLMLGWDPIPGLIGGNWVFSGLPVVYGVLLADEAFEDGVPPLRAYGLAVVVLAVLVASGQLLFTQFFFNDEPIFRRAEESMAQFAWLAALHLYHLAFGLSIYGYWRVTQRAMRQAQAAETERARTEQRVQTARLLTLQARVDPQLLFDALGRVGDLHDREPQAADGLLADLIALLRSMQPGAVADNSTVGREFELVEAWLRVTNSSGRVRVQVQLCVAPDARPRAIAPMLVLPLLRAVLEQPHGTQDEWRLSAQAAGQRLLITLQPGVDDVGAANARRALATAELSPLHERLVQLFGRNGRLAASQQAPAVTLDLPLLEEDSDDNRIDR